MTRYELEHLIRAAGDIAEIKEMTIFGSQSILGQHPDLDNIVKSKNITASPKRFDINTLIRSIEADIFIENEELADRVEGSIGELSSFHSTHGYYFDAVDETTSKLPIGWEQRRHKISNDNTGGVTAWCIDKHDLILSKLYANREKDIEFFKAMKSLSLLKKKTLLQGLNNMSIGETDKDRIKNIILKEFKK